MKGLSGQVTNIVTIVQELDQLQTFQLTLRGKIGLNQFGLNQFGLNQL